ncbi:hypothetical protein SUGI_0251730 [Cryptomeria japonica]|nr:hypothetical protein SUGI_0251730 [Cryptomeria japonica]
MRWKRREGDGTSCARATEYWVLCKGKEVLRCRRGPKPAKLCHVKGRGWVHTCRVGNINVYVMLVLLAAEAA